MNYPSSKEACDRTFGTAEEEANKERRSSNCPFDNDMAPLRALFNQRVHARHVTEQIRRNILWGFVLAPGNLEGELARAPAPSFWKDGKIISTLPTAGCEAWVSPGTANERPGPSCAVRNGISAAAVSPAKRAIVIS